MPSSYAVNRKCWINSVHEFMKRGHNVLGTLAEQVYRLKTQNRWQSKMKAPTGGPGIVFMHGRIKNFILREITVSWLTRALFVHSLGPMSDAQRTTLQVNLLCRFESKH